MRASLFSPLWYRVAAHLPRLAADVSVRQQPSRDEAWYVLVNAATGRQCRINRSAYQFVGRCNGRYSVQRIWDALLTELRDEAPTQDEVIQVLGRLAAQGLLEYGTMPDLAVQAEQRDRRATRRWRANLNPLAFRVPLGDPSALLEWLIGLRRVLFRPLVAWLWAGALGLAIGATVVNWDALGTHATTYLGTPRYLFLAWAAFPFIKALHELAHGLAVRHWGGEVHEAGIALFVLTPTPYVDASASAGFRRRYQRATVAAVGIMVELALAAIALLAWLNLQPGLLRDLAFVTMFVASVSTLLFNANPLLRFDGYYVLCDALDLPNLATRSRQYWLALLQRAAFGNDGVAALQVAPGERNWLAAYAPLSFGYRIFISAVIVLWVGHYSLALGAMLTVYVAIAVVLLPVVTTVRNVLAGAPATTHPWRARTLLGAVAVSIGLLLFVVPLPFRTVAWGVVWLPDHARVRAQTDGFVANFAVRDGEQVVPGQLLLTLEDPMLFAQREQLTSELTELRADRFEALLHDPLAARNREEAQQRVQGDLLRIDERISQLEVRGRSAGTLVIPRQQDLPGSFVRRGTTLGYVLDRAEIGVRVAVPERDAALIRERVDRVEVRLAEAAGEALVAGLVRDVPAAGYELPSAALGDQGGGPYPTDPADKDGLRSREPVVLIDLVLPERMLERVGGRTWVRFEHGAQPLAVQSYRRVRQLFLQHFNPSG